MLVARGHGGEGQDSRGSLFAVLELMGHPYAGRQVIKEISIKKKKIHFTFCSQQRVIALLVLLLASFLSVLTGGLCFDIRMNYSTLASALVTTELCIF